MARLIDDIREGRWASMADYMSGRIEKAHGLALRADELKNQLKKMRTLGLVNQREDDRLRRMADNLHQAIAGIHAHKAELQPLFESAVPICADEVAEFVYTQEEPLALREWDLSKDFPVLSPPFPVCFIEWKRPDRVLAARMNLERIEGGILRRSGILVLGGSSAMPESCPVPGVARTPGCAHWIAFTTVGDLQVNGIMEFGEWGGIAVDELGRVVDASHVPDDKLFRHMSAIGLMAVCFMHCKKGVRVVEVVPPGGINQARQRRKKKPLISHRTIVISGLRQMVQRAIEEDAEGGTLRRALHIVRGHFACYTDRPLFGHYRGLVFRPMHTRGRQEEGVVTKDYVVKNPWTGSETICDSD